MPDLPELTLPRVLPAWLAAGHSVEAEPVYSDTPMRTGEARRRRCYRTAARVVPVGMFLKPGMSPVFWDWYENRLEAGSRPFSTRVPNQGPGLLWWRAEFVEPPEYTMLPRGMARVRAKLLLTGSGSVEGPPDGAMVAESIVATYGSAAVTVGKQLVAESVVALLPATRMQAESVVEVLGSVTIAIDRIASAADSCAGGDTASASLVLVAAASDSSAGGGVASLSTVSAAAAADSAAAGDVAAGTIPLPVWNSATAGSALTLSNSNKTAARTGGANGGSVNSTAVTAKGVSSGKFYCAVKLDVWNANGVTGSFSAPEIAVVAASVIGDIGVDANLRTSLLNGTTTYKQRRAVYTKDGSVTFGTSAPVSRSSISVGQYLTIAADVTNKLLWFGINNTWTGDPVAGTGGASMSSWDSAIHIAFAGYNVTNSPDTMTIYATDADLAAAGLSIPSGFVSFGSA